jgi:hypothetical protein
MKIIGKVTGLIVGECQASNSAVVVERNNYFFVQFEDFYKHEKLGVRFQPTLASWPATPDGMSLVSSVCL